MSILIPRPARDLILNPLQIYNSKNDRSLFQPGMSRLALFNLTDVGALTLPDAQKTIKAACRIALAALGMLALYKIGGSMVISAIVGSAISLPTVAIATGSWLVYKGISALATSIISGSFASLGYGAVAFLGGWVALESYDVLPFGIAEVGFDSAAESYAPSLVEKLIS